MSLGKAIFHVQTQHLRDNLGALSLELSDKEFDEIADD